MLKTPIEKMYAPTIQKIILKSDEDHSFFPMIHTAMEQVVLTGRWNLGHVYLPRQDETEKVSHFWFMPNNCYEPFRSATENMCSGDPNSMLHKTILDEQPHWVTNVCHDPSFLRADFARDAGLMTWSCFPISGKGSVLGAIEFFSDHEITREQDEYEMLKLIGMLLGHLIQRNYMERSLADDIWLQQQRVGREIHDGICQDLMAVSFMSKRLRSRLKQDDHKMMQAMDSIIQTAEAVLDKAKATAKGLCPVQINAHELVTAMEEMVHLNSRRFGITIRQKINIDTSFNNHRKAQQLYLIAHEAVVNAIKHGKADVIELMIHHNNHDIIMRIRDNGIGLQHTGNNSSGMGLNVIRHRAGSIGANLQINSRPGEGTEIICLLALTREDFNDAIDNRKQESL